jgi:hypothetical protein
MPEASRYRVALSYPGEERPLVSAVARQLTEALGRDRVFYDRFYEAELARLDLDIHLQGIYGQASDLIVVFLSRDYDRKDWCRLEWRAIRSLIQKRQAERILLVRTDDLDPAQIPGLFAGDGYLDARSRAPEEVARLILDRLVGVDRETKAPPRAVSRPGLLRYVLDRIWPGLHLRLTRLGTFSEPPEMADLHTYLASLRAGIENDLREKTYLPLAAKAMPRRAGMDLAPQDPFVLPVHQVIRHVLGREEGGDSASAQIAAVNRRSRLVRNILRTLRNTVDPLVLLGDPGSGKSMTLQQAALELAASGFRRVFPTVVVYVRLGEFHVEGKVGPEDVRSFVWRSAPERLRPWLDGLDRAGRLVVLFDGMDEMSRDRYSEHTEALSLFAGSRRGITRALFSCRITDFSPAFLHRRLVLLPFDRSQIRTFLERYLPARSLTIDGVTRTIPQLARQLAAGDLPVETHNPFVLWLLCLYLQEQGTWPASRVDLLGFYNRKNYERKREDAEEEGIVFPAPEEAFRAWARYAYEITERNRGAAIPVEDLYEDPSDAAAVERTHRMIRIGKWCGVLAESLEGTIHQIRFEHHRFQEYFAALHIREANPAVDWLGRLDAPRWQETMVNLVLMGGAEDGVLALAGAIEEPVRRHQAERERFEIWLEERKKKTAEAQAPQAPAETAVPEEKEKKEEKEVEQKKPPKMPDSEEAVLADRIELGARLIGHGKRTAAAVQERLKPSLREAVGFLVKEGNPITQVKMMRACQRLTDLDLLTALEKPLRSNVRWVKDQALVLVAAMQPGARSQISNLPAEMGIDLATGSFLSRWLAYLKAVRYSRQASAWWSFALATFLSLGSVLLYLATAWAAHGLGRRLLEMIPGFLKEFGITPEVALLTDRLEAHLFVAGLVVVATPFFARNYPREMWCTIPGSALVGLGLVLGAHALWAGTWIALFWLILSPFLLIPSIGIFAIPGGTVHFGALSLYLFLTRGARGRNQGSSLFFSVAWREGGFEFGLKFFLWGLGAVLVIFLIVLIAPWLAFLGPVLVWIFQALAVLFSVALFGMSAFVGWVLLSAAFKEAWQGFPNATRWARHNLGLGKIALYLFWIILGLGLVFGLIFLFVTFSLHMARGLLLAVTLVVLLLIWLKLLRLIWRAFAVSWSYPPDSFTRESWEKLLRNSSPREQEIILQRTNHQSLSLQPDEYLEVLEKIRDHIRYEPALSTYWDLRDQLEQALRQERRG